MTNSQVRKTFGVGLLLLLSLRSGFISCDEVKVVKIYRPVIVTLDRRPEKDIHYSKCIAAFDTADGDVLEAAVEVAKERVCPSSESIVLDNQPDKIVSDGGKTETSNHLLNEREFQREYRYSGKNWKLMSHPSKVSTKARKIGTKNAFVEDVFFTSWVWDEISKEKMLLISDKADSITDVFETRHKTYEPLPPVDESKLTRHSQQPRTTERPTHR